MKLVSLFSGCGGFSLGAQQAGLTVAAAFDNDPVLASSYPYNFPATKMTFTDAATLDAKAIEQAAGGCVDGIFGGPPCQGFSLIGKRNPADPRRLLIGHFFRLIREVRPRFFVMENVPGLNSPGCRKVLDEALLQVEDDYALVGPTIWNAADFGAATNRSRLFIVGTSNDTGEPPSPGDFEALKREPSTVRAAISDMLDAHALGTQDGFDTWRIARLGRPTEYARSLRSPDRCFTGHRTTDHSPTVVTRFNEISQGGTDPIGRHPRLAWSGQCPALRAGTGPDHGSYQSVRPIHPDEPRVITVREAARLQGFPDAHRFHATVWHSFRMIGNSVSPIIAEAIFSVIAAHFGCDSSVAHPTE